MDDTEKHFLGNDRFQIECRLGAGGIGEVHQAFDKKKNAMVALKTLSHLAPLNISRFKKEFFSLSKIDHPNFVRLIEFFEEADLFFFTMELVNGNDFLSRVRTPEQKLDEHTLRKLLGQLATGIFALHQMGKAHRDIKPSNILVTDEDRVVILDSGLFPSVISGHQLEYIEAIGTEAYMSPEQSIGMPVGASGDWYSMGILLYQSLTGKLPYEGSSFKTRIDRQLSPPTSPSVHAPAAPPDLVSLCMDLLNYDPKTRPNGREILKRLGVDVSSLKRNTFDSLGAEIYAESLPYVGREKELNTLHAAFDSNHMGHDTSILIQGEPGLGKTALAHKFFEQGLEKHENLVVLSGKCLKNTALHFQAFDAIVTELGNYVYDFFALSPSHGEEEKEARTKTLLTPEEASAVLQVFPRLRYIQTIYEAAKKVTSKPNAGQSRVGAFRAVRKLLLFVATQHPLILFIDDLQWAKTDSLDMLQEVMIPEKGAPLFLVATMRSDSPISHNIEEILPNLKHLILDEITKKDATDLAIALCQFYHTPYSAEHVNSLTKEARGHPFFLAELVRHLAVDGDIKKGRLEEVLWLRIQRLDKNSIRLLQLISLAGVALNYVTLAEAAEMKTANCIRYTSSLIAQNLVRSSGAIRDETIEPYHDRVHETVTSRIEEKIAKKYHSDLARAMGALTSGIEPAIIVKHLEAAGSTQRAGKAAERAASQAEDSLAFGQAVDLIQTALRLGEPSDAKKQKLLMRLGDALCNIGQGTEASKAYLEARQGANAAMRIDLWRQAAEQLILSGLFDEGREELRLLLVEIGEGFPASNTQALFSLLRTRAFLKLRGLKWKDCPEVYVDAKELARIDVYQAVSENIGLVDNLLGANYQARHLLAVLRTGERKRTGHAFALEAMYLALMGKKGTIKNAEVLLKRGDGIARKHSNPNLQAMILIITGHLNYCKGHLKEAKEFLLRADQELTGKAQGTTIQLNFSHLIEMFVLRFLGDYQLLNERTEVYLRDAARRGDKYTEANIRYLRSQIFLYLDQPQEAASDLASIVWSPPEGGGYHLQHWYGTIAQAELALYRKTVPEQIDKFEMDFKALAKSLLLRIGAVRAESGWLQGRILLAVALVSNESDKQKLLKRTSRLAKKLTTKKTGFRQSEIWALLLHAAIAYQRGKLENSISYLERAITESEEKESPQLAATARRRLGQILGGPEGAKIKAEGDDWMKEKGIVNLESITNVFVPGFPSIDQNSD